jgi:uncharacterized membrane protein
MNGHLGSFQIPTGNCLTSPYRVFSLSVKTFQHKEVSKGALLVASMLCAALGASSPGQNPPPAKKLPAGPAAPQSTHYPIMILAFGNDPNWSLRIGQKGPERMDRPGYPPIPLEAAEVTHEAAADSWTYHAKDSATGAAVAIHLTRESCTDATNDTITSAPPLGGKYSFRVSVDHAQIGSLKGCARIAAELFPKINNQPDQEEDDDAKKKPPVPVSTVTNFKSPVAVAYINASQQLVFRRGSVTRIIPGKPGYGLSISHDGKKLLFTRDEGSNVRTINQYDFDSNSVKEVLRGSVQQAFWSPDDTRFAFMKFVDGKWNLWSAPIASPDGAASIFLDDILLQGWADAHAMLVDELQQLCWVTDTGTIQQAIPEKDILGDAFGSSSADTFRVHPSNPDLLLVSAEWLKPPAGVPIDAHMGNGFGFFLYEIRSKRRVLLSPLNMFAQNAEWSRDGFQIFFTGADSSRRSATYRMFWDGIGLQKYVSGTALVIGQ